MAFLNPWLLVGLAGIAVPILIHLLNRYRHREVDWAAMELLRRALVVRARQIRIEDILILLLRCLAVALLALAMARPTLRTGAMWFGRDAQVGVVLAIDASYSAAHRPGIRTRFDDAIERVREVASTLDAGNPVTLMLMGRQPRLLLRNVGYEAERVEKELADLEPLPERLDLEYCLEEAETLMAEVKAPVRECYLVTDAQATSWQELSDKARHSMANIAELGKLFILSTASQSAENVAVSHFALASGTLRQGSLARCVAEVRNCGRQPVERVTATLYLDEKPVDQRVVDRVAAGETRPVPLFTRFDRVGTARLGVRLGPDPLPTDNERSLVATVRERVRILCVDGDPSDKPYQGETDYLVTALAPRRAPGRSPLEIRSVSWLELSSQRLADYDVVVLANVPDVSSAQASALHAFVHDGGGLMVFAGDKIIPRIYNARLRHDGAGLLPGELEPLVVPAGGSEGLPIEPLSTSHPLSAPLAALPRELVGMARVHRYLRVRLAAGGHPLISLAGADTTLLSEKAIGRGKVLLFATTADRDWSNLVVHPVGPILLHQAVTYLTREAHERPFTVAEPLVLPLPGRTAQASVTVRDPGGGESPIQVTERDGEQAVELARPDLPGFYEIDLGDRSAPLVLAVNVDATESDVACLTGESFGEVLSGVDAELFADGGDLVAAIRESRVGRELWRELLVLALIVLLVEAFLAHYFSRRIARAAEAKGVDHSDLLAGPESAPAS
ncbi:MAG: BatA domain-containing protein [Planctomycetota bacterium]